MSIDDQVVVIDIHIYSPSKKRISKISIFMKYRFSWNISIFTIPIYPVEKSYNAIPTTPICYNFDKSGYLMWLLKYIHLINPDRPWNGYGSKNVTSLIVLQIWEQMIYMLKWHRPLKFWISYEIYWLSKGVHLKINCI